ncbi:unnamed protein product, partial [Amoebophrya sp. A25]|eukprot:GSA25T00027147001.1
MNNFEPQDPSSEDANTEQQGGAYKNSGTNSSMNQVQSSRSGTPTRGSVGPTRTSVGENPAFP